jgi:hypothetical protein
MARQSTKADVESAVAMILTDVKQMKKETSQIAALKKNVDLIVVYLQALGSKIDDSLHVAVVSPAVSAETSKLLSTDGVIEKFKALDKLLDDIFLQFPVVKEIS